MKKTMQKNRKKLIAGALSICLIGALAIGGTMAYLTDSEKVTNTFSVGDLDITLAEPEWDDTTDGKDLVPGDTKKKDPTITAVEHDSYMRVIMEIQDKNGNPITNKERLDLIMQTIRYANPALSEDESFALADLAAVPAVNRDFTLIADKSSPATPTDDNPATGVYYYNYNNVLNEGDTATLFTNVVIPTDWNQKQLQKLGEYKIVISAQAIQVDNFANAAAAFAALDAEVTAGTIQENYATVGGVTVTP